MVKPLIAILSPDTDMIATLRERLKDVCRIEPCTPTEDLNQQLQESNPHTFVADFRLIADGGHQEKRLLEGFQAQCPEMQIVLLTDQECPEPLERLAACSNIAHLHGSEKDQRIVVFLEELIPACTKEVSAAETSTPSNESTRVESRKTIDPEAPAESALIGITRRFETSTPKLHRMLVELEVAARHDVTILLVGETGSGKTFLSRLIHEVSPRNGEPFLHVPCGALPAELIESELFGHVKGAFTSAHADKEGKFVAAAKGTVLLDEIDALGPEQQVKLLRVIETGEFEPVGSNDTRTSQARLVVASNLDLQPLVEQGKFRPDLYYRLSMLKFEIPPLRERKPDIRNLVQKLVDQLAKKHNAEIKTIDDTLFAALLAYPWPGNVRELENVIQRAVIYSRDGVLSADQLPQHVLEGVAGPTNDPSVSLTNDGGNRSSLGRQIALTEREIIEQALFTNNFSRTNTAKDLGISRVTLYNKMKKYGMTKE